MIQNTLASFGFFFHTTKNYNLKFKNNNKIKGSVVDSEKERDKQNCF